MSSAEIERLNAALGDRYRIERELGVGGMATVYLARDVRHDRPVAVKVLRPDLAAVIGVERFLDEIKTTAHLQHAHILGLIDSGQVNGTVFYVMPFVDGESLRARLTREKQIPVPDAVRIATAVAGALDYAHRRGVIHRDIKPENILLHEGQPLVADFGIALAVTRSDSRARVTEAGTSLGTPQYMSPEQAAGERNLDARTDVYSLGCVLYEMLTGEPPFSGPSSQAIIAKVMSVEPEPVTTLRRSVPPNVAAATMTALSKVPADRFASAAEFAAALANPQYVGAALAARRAASAWSRLSGRDIAAFVVIAALAIVAAIGWLRTGGGATAPGVVRFEIPVPDSVLHNQQIGVSRDGSRILWADASGYWERRLDDTAIRRIRETEATQATPTLRGISPDGREVLVSGGGGLAIVPLGTGPGRTLAAGGRGGTWGGDGAIYSTAQGGFSISAPRWLLRITPQTGAVDTLGALPDSSSVNEMVALPDGRALLVAMNRSGQAQLRAFDVRAKTWHMLDEAGGLRVQYLDAGYVIYTRGQYLMAAPLDRGRLEFAQPAMPIAEAASGAFDKLAAAGDVLAYAPAPDPQATRDIAIRSRSGVTRILPNINDTAVFSAFAIAPDGRRIVATGTPQRGQGPGAQGPSNVYVYQLPSGPLTRLR